VTCFFSLLAYGLGRDFIFERSYSVFMIHLYNVLIPSLSPFLPKLFL
jgi:hypothetical protein